MNIWILNHYAVTPKTIGGTRHFDLAQQLIEKGHSVKIFASSFNHINRKESIDYYDCYFHLENIDGIEFVWIKTPPYNNSFKRLLNISVFTIRLNKLLNQYIKKEEPDLIIGSSVHPLTALVGLYKSKKSNSLFYFEERDLWPQTFIDFGILSKKSIISKILLKIEKKLYQESNRVIFLFERAHLYAFEQGLEKHKPIYIPNGYSVARNNNLKAYPNIDDLIHNIKDKKILMYVGSMGKANHLQPLIELAEYTLRETNYHFLFVGNGPLKEKFAKEVAEKKLDNVTFADSIAKEQIPYLLSFAYAGLISMKDSPLYQWGFSMNKIYDYLSVGIPIIMYSNLKHLGNLSKCEGILASSSINTLYEYILQTEKVNKFEMQKFAYDNYSWEILSEQLLLEVQKDMAMNKNNRLKLSESKTD